MSYVYMYELGFYYYYNTMLAYKNYPDGSKGPSRLTLCLVTLSRACHIQ